MLGFAFSKQAPQPKPAPGFVVGGPQPPPPPRSSGSCCAQAMASFLNLSLCGLSAEPPMRERLSSSYSL
jgi:hypothetical protein